MILQQLPTHHQRPTKHLFIFVTPQILAADGESPGPPPVTPCTAYDGLVIAGNVFVNKPKTGTMDIGVATCADTSLACSEAQVRACACGIGRRGETAGCSALVDDAAAGPKAASF
jgi:hypothetical protein